MSNKNLCQAKRAKNDEFYTQYQDIAKEMIAYLECDPKCVEHKRVFCPCDDWEWSQFPLYFATHFFIDGLDALVSTSYVQDGIGKYYTMSDKVTLGYLKGDGDFRSEEVTKLRDEADIIITNPPFSLFREFLHWIVEADKQFIIIGNMNAITYKEVFPLLKENKMWLGYKPLSGGMNMIVPKDVFKDMKVSKYSINSEGKIIVNVMGVCWYSNLDHGKRHEPLMLHTMDWNLKHNQKLRKRLMTKYGQSEDNLHYPHYDNYDAIEVPFVDAIPIDYHGLMGVPISFLDKYSPDGAITVQEDLDHDYIRKKTYKRLIVLLSLHPKIQGQDLYFRIVIQLKDQTSDKPSYIGGEMLCQSPYRTQRN